MFAPRARRACAFTASWDARFLVANSLSNDPVINGHRKGLVNRRGTPCGNLSPAFLKSDERRS